MRRYLCVMLLLALLAGPAVANELVLVGNPDNDLENLSRQQVINIYMGRYRRLPNGTSALPLDHTGYRKDFYRRLVDRTLPEIDSYWARLVFSGRGSPPRQVNDTEELLAMVSQNRGAIGYMPSAEVDDRVVVLAKLNELSADAP